MRIIFQAPTNPENLCIAKIDSAEADNITNQLMLYGSFKGRPALFRITTPVRMVETLYHIGKLTLCNEYTTKIADDNTKLLVVDFYKTQAVSNTASKKNDKTKKEDQKMKIIYNEQKAILEKTQRDIEVPLTNKKIKIYNALLAVITILVIACIWVGWWNIIKSSAYSGNQGAFVFPVALASVFCGGIAVSLSKDTIWDHEKYSANTKYYILKGNKKVIDHQLRYDRNNEYRLWLVTEDESHVVTERLLWPDTFKVQQQTDLTETIVDLENHIVYKPYPAK